jgi:putative transposase
MPRTARKAPGGVIFHVINRGVGRQPLFDDGEDFAAFERVMGHALEAHPLRLLAYCLMPNHWHLLVCPRVEGELGRFMHRLTMTHTRRWQEHRQEVGYGHLYQGRFKSFPVQSDGHFLKVVRYIERNGLRAKLVERAEAWQWSSLWRRAHSGATDTQPTLPLAEWPVPLPAGWLKKVNTPQTTAEMAALRLSISKGRPFGDEQWQKRTTIRLGLQSSHRPPGRPKKAR